MRFSCKKCNAKYAIADEKIRGKIVKVRCKHCGQVVVVRDAKRPAATPAEVPKSGTTQAPVRPSALTKSTLPSPASPEPTLPQSLSPPADVFPSDEALSDQLDDQSLQPEAGLGHDYEQAFKDLYESGNKQTGSIEKDDARAGDESAPRAPVWYYGLDGTEEGPLTSQEMEERISVGSITRDHFVWREGMDDWVPVEKAFGLIASVRVVDSGDHHTAAEEPQLAPSRRADWFEESQLPQVTDDLLLQPAGEQKRDRGEEVTTKNQELPRAEQQLAPRPEPFEDFLADKIALLSDELAEEPVAADSPKPEMRGGEHEIHQASERFFKSGETQTPASELLPPRPMVDAEQVAAELRAESLKEEHADSIPPITEAEHPSSDSVIIRQAGVHSTGRRISLALIAVLVVIVMAGGTLALVLRKDLFNGSQLDSPNPNEETVLVKETPATENSDISSEDAKKIRTFLTGENSQFSPGPKPSLELPKPLPATTLRGLILPGNGQNVFDIGAGEDRQRAKSRVQKEDIGVATAPDVAMATNMSINELRRKKVEATPLPPDRQTGPEKLTDLQVHMVIQKYYAQVKSCQQRQLQRDSSIAGKMIVVARVQPNGSVEAVRIDTPSFRGSFVEECLVKEIKSWLFPSFKGETYDVLFQLQLMAREEVSGR
jgi:hypothetical protein